MLLDKKLGLLTLLCLVVAAAPSATRAEDAGAAGTRIAVISGIHSQEGFALAESVPSDRLCLELAQNLASELGIAVHVVCTDPAGGKSTIVAECGFAESASAEKVGTYKKRWGSKEDPYLVCVPRPQDQFRAHRVAPDLEALRP